MPLDDTALARLREAVREPDLSGTRYRLLGVAGTGGMGTVYAVEDAELGRRVALKVLDVKDGAVEARLRREAQVLARLEHPGIVPVHEVGTLADGRAFYTMKLVLVLDWGLAKVLSDPGDPATAALATRPRPGDTGEGAVLGTPGFMSPEQQAGGSGKVDARADVFSLGALLRWLLQPRAPAPLEAIAGKAMAPEPGDRYPAASDLAQDVARFLDGAAVSAYPEGLLRRGLRFAARHRVAAGIVAAYLVGRGLILLFAGR